MSTHASALVTTSLLTILCVALVHRERPDWLAVGVGEAVRAAALSPERVSRLASRVACPFADIVDTFTRRGRPACIDDPVRAELVTLRGGASALVGSEPLGAVPESLQEALHEPLVGRAGERQSSVVPLSPAAPMAPRYSR
jgi:hypothetical protein